MIYLLICAYNEERDLPGLLKDIREQRWSWPYRVVVVNDGSDDGTAGLLQKAQAQLPLMVIEHARNRGLGAALSTGLNTLLNGISDDDIVVTMDADRTHPVGMIPLMKQTIEAGNDMVIASRYVRGGGQDGLSIHRRLLSRGAALLLGARYGVKGVRDYTSGFRAFSGRLLAAAGKKYGKEIIKETGFTATFELLLKAAACSSRIAEVPLVLHYEQKTGKSKMNVASTLGRYLWLIAGAGNKKISG